MYCRDQNQCKFIKLLISNSQEQNSYLTWSLTQLSLQICFVLTQCILKFSCCESYTGTLSQLLALLAFNRFLDWPKSKRQRILCEGSILIWIMHVFSLNAHIPSKASYRSNNYYEADWTEETEHAFNTFFNGMTLTFVFSSWLWTKLHGFLIGWKSTIRLPI